MLRCSARTFLKVSQPKVLYSTFKLEKRTPLVLKLKAEFDSISYVTRALQNQELSNINFEDWKSRICVLRRHNFNDAECFKMISLYPYLLKIPLENFENSVKQWCLADFGINNFQFLLLSQPQLIDVDMKEIRKRVPQLRVYFKTSEALCNLLAVSPNVMFDNWEAVVEKIHYVVKLNKFNMGDVIQGQALSKSLNFIKFRLELLKKCGIYRQDNTPLHKINKYDKTKYRNPSLKEILNPDGKVFAKLAKISHEEYSVYKNLFSEQEHEKEEEEEEDNVIGYNNH